MGEAATNPVGKVVADSLDSVAAAAVAVLEMVNAMRHMNKADAHAALEHAAPILEQKARDIARGGERIGIEVRPHA